MIREMPIVVMGGPNMSAISIKWVRRVVVGWVFSALVGNAAHCCRAQAEAAKWAPHIQVVLDSTEALKSSREDRLPLYLWQAMDPGRLDDDEAERLVNDLDRRGIGLVTSWDPRDRERSLANSLTVAKAQAKLGLRVNVNATGCLYSFFNGDERTAHVDFKGSPFWDASFGTRKMGCPFTLDLRLPAVREQVEYFVEAFDRSALELDFVFADWEIDGPVEFNEAHATSKRCQRCREQVENIDDFTGYQEALRRIRSRLQLKSFVEPIRSRFPKALVGNYGVYPHNGFRYWYDYYEYYVQGQPHQVDQRARYRKWYHEFPETGYTAAMPVVYPWGRIFAWYDYPETDYRWFYNMLLIASNVGQHTPAKTPIVSFVHWHTIRSKSSPIDAIQLSEEKYQELLWHMLLRGTDTFFLWCGRNEAAKEIQLVHQVYAEAQQYGEFLADGRPITYDVPKEPRPVISGLKLGDRVLVRRTDFTEPADVYHVKVWLDGQQLEISPSDGHCQIIMAR
jgi:hypothetical protein